MLRKKTLLQATLGAVISYNSRSIGITDDDRLWVAYQTSGGLLFCRYSDDGGITWSVEEQVGSAGADMNRPAIQGLGNKLHVVGSDPSLVNSVKYYCRTGDVWGAAEPANNVINGDNADLIVTSAEIPYVVLRYAPSGTYTTVRKRDKLTGSWGNAVDLTVDDGWQVIDMSSALDEENNKIHATWRLQFIADTTQYKIQTASFDMVALSWSAVTTLDSFTRNTVNPIPPKVRLIGDDVWIVWARDGLGTYTSKLQIRYAIYSGGSWGSAQTLTDHDGLHQTYEMLWYADTLHLIYTKEKATIGTADVCQLIYRRYGNSTWSDETILTNSPTNQIAPNAIILGSTAHLTWWSVNAGQYDLVYCPISLERYPELDVRKTYIG
jgi:hypothetical protein